MLANLKLTSICFTNAEIFVLKKNLTLGCLRGFSEGGKSMGGHFDPTLKKRI